MKAMNWLNEKKREQIESKIKVSADRFNIGNPVAGETEQLDLIILIIILFYVMKNM